MASHQTSSFSKKRIIPPRRRRRHEQQQEQLGGTSFSYAHNSTSKLQNYHYSEKYCPRNPPPHHPNFRSKNDGHQRRQQQPLMVLLIHADPPQCSIETKNYGTFVLSSMPSDYHPHDEHHHEKVNITNYYVPDVSSLSFIMDVMEDTDEHQLRPQTLSQSSKRNPWKHVRLFDSDSNNSSKNSSGNVGLSSSMSSWSDNSWMDVLKAMPGLKDYLQQQAQDIVSSAVRTIHNTSNDTDLMFQESTTKNSTVTHPLERFVRQCQIITSEFVRILDEYRQDHHHPSRQKNQLKRKRKLLVQRSEDNNEEDYSVDFIEALVHQLDDVSSKFGPDVIVLPNNEEDDGADLCIMNTKRKTYKYQSRNPISTRLNLKQWTFQYRKNINGITGDTINDKSTQQQQQPNEALTFLLHVTLGNKFPQQCPQCTISPCLSLSEDKVKSSYTTSTVDLFEPKKIWTHGSDGDIRNASPPAEKVISYPFNDHHHHSSSSLPIKQRRIMLRKEDDNDEWKTQSQSQSSSSPSSSGLSRLYQEFCFTVDRYYIPLFEELNHLDSTTRRILDKEVSSTSLSSKTSPSFSDRRIAITNTICMAFTINIMQPRYPPTNVQFSPLVEHRNDSDKVNNRNHILNLERCYQHYTRKWSSKSRNNDNRKSSNEGMTRSSTGNEEKTWSCDQRIHDNLEQCFGIKLPGPNTAVVTTEGDEPMKDIRTGHNQHDCAICYGHELAIQNDDHDDDNDDKIYDYDNSLYTTNVQLPEIRCENGPCGRVYHQSCLYEWLQSLPASRKCFDTLIGTCPYCSELISVPITTSSTLI